MVCDVRTPRHEITFDGIVRRACLGIYHSISALFVAFIASPPNEFSPRPQSGGFSVSVSGTISSRMWWVWVLYRVSDMTIDNADWEMSCSAFVAVRRVGDFDYSLHHWRARWFWDVILILYRRVWRVNPHLHNSSSERNQSAFLQNNWAKRTSAKGPRTQKGTKKKTAPLCFSGLPLHSSVRFFSLFVFHSLRIQTICMQSRGFFPHPFPFHLHAARQFEHFLVSRDRETWRNLWWWVWRALCVCACVGLIIQKSLKKCAHQFSRFNQIPICLRVNGAALSRRERVCSLTDYVKQTNRRRCTMNVMCHRRESSAALHSDCFELLISIMI